MDSPSDNAIVVTGCGWITPFAAGTIADILSAAGDPQHAAPKDVTHWAIPDDFVAAYQNLPKEIRREKSLWMPALSLERACQQAGLDLGSIEKERVGIVLGCALAGQAGMIAFAQEVRDQSARFVSPIHFPQTVGNYMAGALSRGYHTRGPNMTLSCDVASGLDAIVEGCELLATHAADVIIAGGTETLSPPLAQGLSGGGAGSGIVPSDGACLFVLERLADASARGVAPLGAVRRFFRSASSDPMPHGKDHTLYSCAGCCQPGGIFVEHWIGRSFAAAGAAALAAAIGAAAGMDVPSTETSSPDSVTVGGIGGTAKTEEVSALIVAEADGAHRTALELGIPTNGNPN